MTTTRILPIVFFASLPIFTTAQVKPVPGALTKSGDRVCVEAAPGTTGRCYQTATSLGIAFANEVEYVYPHVRAFNRSLGLSPELPKTADALEMIGGAILMEPPTVRMVTEQLRDLRIRNVSVDISGPQPMSEIPCAFTIDWTDRRGVEGTAHVTGSLRIVDKIFDVNLNRTDEFRDRLVNNFTITSFNGPRVPLRSAIGDDYANADTVGKVIIPFLGGKFVSIGRIGFNKMIDSVQGELQKQLDTFEDERGPQKPL